MTRTPVLHVLNASGGGAAQCAVELIRGLRERDFLPFVAAPGLAMGSSHDACRSIGVEWTSIPMGWWNRKTRLTWPKRMAFSTAQNLQTFGNIKTVYSLVHAIKRWNIQIVHTHTGLIPWGAVAARVAGVRHVWHIHEPNGWRQPFTYWLPDFAYARLLDELSDWVVCVSNFVAKIFVKHPGHAPVEVIYQGIDVPKYSKAAGESALRKSLGIQDDEIMIGMVAGLSSTWKRHNLFVQMAEKLAGISRRVRFVIFGALPGREKGWLYSSAGDYADEVRTMVAEKNLSERFLFPGFHADAPAVMNAIDILVHPCDVEGFGRVAIEAMAAGRPVVGPNRGGIAESVIDGETGLLSDPGDYEMMASHCRQLIENPGLRFKLGENGRAHAAKNFAVQNHVDRIAGIYERIIRIA